jgi:prepilin-type N-terminal cleavage/methylation domain-containing protein
MSRASDRPVSRGATLLELIVSLAVLGASASIAVLMLRPQVVPNPHDPATVISDSLEQVLNTGASATLGFVVNEHLVQATINPDGSVVADSALPIDRLTGRFER